MVGAGSGRQLGARRRGELRPPADHFDVAAADGEAVLAGHLAVVAVQLGLQDDLVGDVVLAAHDHGQLDGNVGNQPGDDAGQNHHEILPKATRRNEMKKHKSKRNQQPKYSEFRVIRIRVSRIIA